MTNLYATCTRTAKGLRGQIILDGQPRWVREAADGYQLAQRLRAIKPDLGHVLTENGVLDTGCLTLGECLEAVAG